MLSPILFWFANSLELYHFLFSKQDVLDLLLKNAVGGKEMTSEDATSTESNALTMLELMLQHMFQRAFYSISKVLFYCSGQDLHDFECYIVHIYKSCVYHLTLGIVHASTVYVGRVFAGA